MDALEFKELLAAVDNAGNGLKEYLARPNPDNKSSKIEMLKNSSDARLKSIAYLYEKNIGKFFERQFQSSKLPEGMNPDFSQEPIDSYSKGDITIEEYKVSNDKGDELVFAMASDGQGRVYIDNIYDPRVGMTDYGTHKEICQMGHLIYKPEDYSYQTFGIPQKYKKPVLDQDGKETGYIDINSFWENIPLIREYKEKIAKRKRIEAYDEDIFNGINQFDKKIREIITSKEWLEVLKNNFKAIVGEEWTESFDFEEFKENLNKKKEGTEAYDEDILNGINQFDKEIREIIIPEEELEILKNNFKAIVGEEWTESFDFEEFKRDNTKEVKN
jgi:hypothetical protein